MWHHPLAPLLWDFVDSLPSAALSRSLPLSLRCTSHHFSPVARLCARDRTYSPLLFSCSYGARRVLVISCRWTLPRTAGGHPALCRSHTTAKQQLFIIDACQLPCMTTADTKRRERDSGDSHNFCEEDCQRASFSALRRSFSASPALSCPPHMDGGLDWRRVPSRAAGDQTDSLPLPFLTHFSLFPSLPPLRLPPPGRFRYPAVIFTRTSRTFLSLHHHHHQARKRPQTHYTLRCTQFSCISLHTLPLLLATPPTDLPTHSSNTRTQKP